MNDKTSGRKLFICQVHVQCLLCSLINDSNATHIPVDFNLFTTKVTGISSIINIDILFYYKH